MLKPSLCLALLLAATSSFADAKPSVGQRISEYCRGNGACIARQKRSLQHYLGIAFAYDGSKAVMERCMLAGKRAGPYVDWSVSEQCMRRWSKGRKSNLPGARR